MEAGKTNEATDIKVPTVEKPKVDLKEVQQRLRRELSQFKQTLQEADDPILAAQIVTESETRIKVTYHDLKTIKDNPDWDELTLEQQLQNAYGQVSSNVWKEAKEGKRTFSVQDGMIREENVKTQGGEIGSIPSTSAEFNTALQGLADQHSLLMQQRLAISAAGVKVPTVIK